ncbi:MAG: Ig-like domain-containing protein [Clostridia bacterium]|nr:Ig-like domain-containing protein [Clostridia bacterium]
MKRVLAMTVTVLLLVTAIQPLSYAATIMYAKYAVNLRSSPSTSGTIYKTIPKGGQITRLSSSSTNGYYRVSYKGVVGYALASAFTTSSSSGSGSSSGGGGGGGGFPGGGFGSFKPKLKLSQNKIVFTLGDDPVQLTATVTMPTMPGAGSDDTTTGDDATNGDETQTEEYTYTWTSLDPTVATVSEDGLVTPVGQGSCKIKCIVTTSMGKVTKKCTVKVKPVVPTAVTLDTYSITLEVGETYQLTATVAPDDATNKSVKWSSKKKKIAKVSNSGLVTAVKVGTTRIICKTQSGSKKAVCVVTVVAKTSGE